MVVLRGTSLDPSARGGKLNPPCLAHAEGWRGRTQRHGGTKRKSWTLVSGQAIYMVFLLAPSLAGGFLRGIGGLPVGRTNSRQQRLQVSQRTLMRQSAKADFRALATGA